MYKLFIALGIVIILLMFLLPLIFFDCGSNQNNGNSTQKNVNLVEDLSGDWKFSIGDSPERKEASFNDDDWISLKVPANWEEQGFHGYNGYAWYRKTFTIKNFDKYTVYYLNLGFVDDVEETFINGKKIGFSGRFPPNYLTAYYAQRYYYIPSAFLTEGENVIAVRIFDAELQGGILSGEIGIYKSFMTVSPEIDLSGDWLFSINYTGGFDESIFTNLKWDTLFVPGFWEYQGDFWEYNDSNPYDGLAWYRKNFTVPDSFLNKELYLIAGKIDDYDKTYINGKMIGMTGEHWDNLENANLGEAYEKLRVYQIPKTLLRKDTNSISIQVYDGFINGGIWEGPIGLITKEEYDKRKR